MSICSDAIGFSYLDNFTKSDTFLDNKSNFVLMFCRQKTDRQTTDKEVRRLVTEFSQFDEKYHVMFAFQTT